MTTVDQLLAQTEPKRDSWGRYRLTDPATGKERSYTRATTVAGTLKDTYRLGLWQQRMTALGLARRQDLLGRVASCTPDQRDELDKLVEAAKEAAEASAGANKGTALHAFTARANRGEKGMHIPAPFDADVAAYQAALSSAGITIIPERVEQVVVLHDLGVAGTFDCLAFDRNYLSNPPLVADLKTAQAIYDFMEISVQLSLYAHADTIWDVATGQHVEMPKVDQDKALIFHLPAGSGTCTIYELDIAQGWEIAQIALDVRARRSKQKHLANVMTATTIDAVPSAAPVVTTETTNGSDGHPRPSEPGLVRASLERKVQGFDTAQLIVLSTKMKQRDLPRLSLCPGKRLSEWVQIVKEVSPQLGHRVTPESGTLIQRVEALGEIVGGIAALQMQLTTRALPKLSECPPDLLDEWTNALWDAERQVGAPFPAGEAETPDLLASLEQSFTAAKAARTDPIAGLPGSEVKAEQWPYTNDKATADRKRRIRDLIAHFPDEAIEAFRLEFDKQWDDLTDEDTDRLEVIVNAVNAFLIAFTDDEGTVPTLMSTDQAYDAILEVQGGKGKALKAAQKAAKELGRPSPRTAVEAANDPVLAAYLGRAG